MKNTRKLGDAGERLARERLTAQGYSIVETNWHYGRYGEIDIVAWHEKCLVFIEVRLRRGDAAGTPEESITGRKRQRLAMLVQGYLQQHPELADQRGDYPGCRIDVVAIQLANNGKLERCDIIVNAVED